MTSPNTIQEYIEAEQLLVIAELQRCFDHVGECDSCAGRVRGCRTDCFVLRKETPHLQIWDWVDIVVFWNFPDHAPTGCSMQWIEKATPRFDLFVFPQQPLDYDEWTTHRDEHPEGFIGGDV